MHSLTVGLAPGYIEAFLRLMLTTRALDFGPWATRPQRAARLEELVDDVGQDPYMTEVLRPAGLRYDVQVACVSGGRSWGHLCLRRRQEDGPFAGHERACWRRSPRTWLLGCGQRQPGQLRPRCPVR